MKKGIVYKGEGLFGFAAWPSVGRLADGRLAVIFSGDRMKHVCPFGKTMICYSSDEGKTWTAPSAVVNTVFDDRDGGITVRGKQVLVTSFNNNYKFQLREARQNNDFYTPIINQYVEMNKGADESKIGSSISVSEDGGNTFPVRYNVPITAPHGPIVLKDGRYFYVGRSFTIGETDRNEGMKYNFLPDGIYYMFSDDGYTWTKPKSIPLPPEGENRLLYCEPHAIQLDSGEVMVHVRVQPTYPVWGALRTSQTISSNGITEWSPLTDLNILGSPSHLMRHSSGAIVCVTGRREKPYAEQAMISRDEGKSWSEPIVLDGDSVSDDLGYPATVELMDGSLLTVYYQHDAAGEKNNIKYTIWNLPEEK